MDGEGEGRGGELLLAKWGRGGGGGIFYVYVCTAYSTCVRSMGVCVVLGLGLGRYSDAMRYNTIQYNT